MSWKGRNSGKGFLGSFDNFSEGLNQVSNSISGVGNTVSNTVDSIGNSVNNIKPEIGYKVGLSGGTIVMVLAVVLLIFNPFKNKK